MPTAAALPSGPASRAYVSEITYPEYAFSPMAGITAGRRISISHAP